MEKINKLIKAQDMLFNQMERLDNNDLMNNGNGKREIMRSGALSQSVCAYIKAVNTNIKVREMVKNNPQGQETLLKELGVISEN